MDEVDGVIVSCAACSGSSQRTSCNNAFSEKGIVKVHWECWSACNLNCGFCFRTRGVPLEEEEAKLLLLAIAASGVTSIVFAGGDPTLRRDLPLLIAYSKQLGLQVEVQTNAHYMPKSMAELLSGENISLIGLSLDGASPNTHDFLRSTRGNFDRVLDFLNICRAAHKPVIMRTVVNKNNLYELADIGGIISKYDNVIRWSLLEFTSIGDGYANEEKFKVSRSAFSKAANYAASQFAGRAEVDIYYGEAKKGTYAMVTPDGHLYGTSYSAEGRYPLVGSLLRNHLSDLAAGLPFHSDNHHRRYGSPLKQN